MPLEAFTTILNANKVNVGKAEVELLQTELDPQKTGNICYGEFLNAMFLT
jgi:Ca2+-binding EF-hand superfamily protein